MPDERLFGFDDLYEADFDPSRFLDAETSEIADMREFTSQMNTLIERGDYDALTAFISPRLAEAEELTDRLAYTSLLAAAAGERGDSTVTLFHLDALEQELADQASNPALTPLFTTRALVLIERGDLDEAREALDTARGYYEAFDPEAVPEEVRRFLEPTLQRLVYSAETSLCAAYADREDWGAIKEEAAARLANPVSAEESCMLRMGLAQAEVMTGDAVSAQRNLREAERVAVESTNHDAATQTALMEGGISLYEFGGLSSRDALARAGEHLKRYVDGIDYEVEHVGELVRRYNDLAFQINRAGL
ncbi:MAG: hypothetical protein WD603_02570 [Patescibacteria group bacterium]